MKSTKFATPLLGVCLLVLAGLAAATQATASTSATSYAEYRNDFLHYSLVVPDDMTATAFDLRYGGQIVMFSDAAGNKEFQISAWPYTQLDLTLGREEEPGTVRDQPDHLELVDVVRDDIFTVLFVKNGVRYAVTTLPGQEAWLREILTTWQFI